jgi:hypothetical protein
LPKRRASSFWFSNFNSVFPVLRIAEKLGNSPVRIAYQAALYSPMGRARLLRQPGGFNRFDWFFRELGILASDSIRPRTFHLASGCPVGSSLVKNGATLL